MGGVKGGRKDRRTWGLSSLSLPEDVFWVWVDHIFHCSAYFPRAAFKEGGWRSPGDFLQMLNLVLLLCLPIICLPWIWPGLGQPKSGTLGSVQG